MSYGFLAAGAVYGAVVLWRTKTLKYRILVTWAICHSAAIFLPIFFNRRVTQGLNIALALLAAAGLVAALEVFRRRTGRRPHIVLLSILLFFSFGMSTVWVTAQDLSFIMSNGRTLPYFFYLSNDYREAFDWLKKNGDDTTVVLSAPITGNFIPALAGRRVVIGHNVETIHFEDRQRESKAFFDDATDSDRQALLERHNVAFVIDGPWENRLGAFDPASASYLTPVFKTLTVSIYRPVSN